MTIKKFVFTHNQRKVNRNLENLQKTKYAPSIEYLLMNLVIAVDHVKGEWKSRNLN